MSNLTRRQLLIFFGASAGSAVIAPVVGENLLDSGAANAVVSRRFTPIRLPHPLPIYQEQNSYYATGIGQGNVLNATQDTRLTKYTIIDDVVVPPEYDRYVIVSWGDRVFANKEEYFGYNCDYTGFVPIYGDNDGYLWVNHEYVSYPITALAPDSPEDVAGFPESFPAVVGYAPTAVDRTLLGEFLYNMGGSVVRIARRDRNGRFSVVSDRNNRRLHTLSGLGINSDRTDAYKHVTSWGTKSYQKGDRNYLIGTGAAAKEVFPISSDGLGNKIIGTGHNCSGGTTPWGRILSAEENFQGSKSLFVGVQEAVKPNGTQTEYITGSSGAEFGMVGEKYGWIVEIDPADPNYRPRKHTALGRFRHENITMRVERGKKLVAYMGDDRRGGHTYKFVSAGNITEPKDKNNSNLFESGTLYVARYNANGTGKWIPLELNTPTNPNTPSEISAVEVAKLGKATNNGLVRLPRRNGVAGQTTDGGALSVTINTASNSITGATTSYAEADVLPAYRNKRLADFYPTQGAMLCDAFLAANLVGGSPTARPEDLEVHPRTKEVYIAYTDGAPGSDGYPDSRIFVVSKYTSAVNDAQPSGELFKITEDSADGTGLSFRWQRFAKGGEAGTKIGSGFANVDNLVFDKQGNVWGVTDMSTGSHNGFDVGATAEPKLIEHSVVGATSTSQTDADKNAATSDLVGIFGNNWLFYIPTRGPDAGEVVPFAYGPPRCEMTGPTFVGDTLIISIQHPGEDCPFNPQATLNRDIEMLNLDGTLFTQNRTLPRGSNWPSNIQGNALGAPRPSVIGIQVRRSP
ncbi:PhoX family protein [Aliterella atlantica]|uniref:Phosphatase n=1 Tax=Aliterella atlantica CENA595 TaxID=1618023 RepID=A0A0D8ZQW1_9CYAN|nr:PhoX family phosphatase [Aliterella atlantica]KJH70884.1 hypothetical protein UH38_15970 [Aliterella atlantica CENA595]